MTFLRKLERQRLRLNGVQPTKVLDRYNDTLSEKYLHPTKGYRHISLKRSRVTLLTAEIKRGAFPWSMTLIQRELGLLDG